MSTGMMLRTLEYPTIASPTTAVSSSSSGRNPNGSAISIENIGVCRISLVPSSQCSTITIWK